MNFKNLKKNLSTFVVLLYVLFSSGLNAQNVAPSQALAVGYIHNTFQSNLKQNEIDIKDSRTNGFKWYIGKFFGWKPTVIKDLDIKNNGPLVIKTGHNNEIATAAPVNSPKKWVGTAFGGGGYFEVVLKFNPLDVLKKDRVGWPSFWGMAIEHMANLPEEQWQGQEQGYVHFIEVDFFEYLFGSPDKMNVYSGNIHEWFGKFRKSCPEDVFCKHSVPYDEIRREIPLGTNLQEYHKYGFLWVPATKSAAGWGQFFFDDKPVGAKVTWQIYEGQSPSLTRQPWTFGILDHQHLVLLLGTGNDQPLSVHSVNVWQISADRNWVQ